MNGHSFSNGRATGRLTPMEPLARAPLPLLILGLTLALLAVLGFQGWLAHGADMVLVLGQSGLSWCL